MADLSRLGEMFSDIPVEVLQDILYRQGNFEAAVGAILTGEEAETEGFVFPPKLAAHDGQPSPASEVPTHQTSAKIPPLSEGSAPGADAIGEISTTRLVGIRTRLKNVDGGRIRALGSKLQKLNLVRMIDEMEKDQHIADDLEWVNAENEELDKWNEVKREAEAAGMKVIKDHLEGFIQNNPQGTYERWIEELHPENANEGMLLDGLGKEIDHRFYVRESDHRDMWNGNLDGVRTFVPARSVMHNADAPPAVDLLVSDIDSSETRYSGEKGRDSHDLIVFD